LASPAPEVLPATETAGQGAADALPTDRTEPAT
jgi:hypothetical protein